ncbi:unnamed protein product, partial [marine sediment metagenome]
ERFFQPDGAIDQGTGIGLPLAKKLIELHGGRIEVESLVNTGSLFTIYVPMGKDHLPADSLIEGDVDYESIHQSPLLPESDLHSKDKT